MYYAITVKNVKISSDILQTVKSAFESNHHSDFRNGMFPIYAGKDEKIYAVIAIQSGELAVEMRDLCICPCAKRRADKAQRAFYDSHRDSFISRIVQPRLWRSVVRTR